MRNDLILDYRQRFAQEQSEKALTRERELARQCSALVPPDERIRQWEKLHGLRLPHDPAHPILYVIAAATGLTVVEVRTHQHLRFTHQPDSTAQGLPSTR